MKWSVKEYGGALKTPYMAPQYSVLPRRRVKASIKAGQGSIKINQASMMLLRTA
jgi:hypothetical protein